MIKVFFKLFIFIRSFSACPENEPKEGTRRGKENLSSPLLDHPLCAAVPRIPLSYGENYFDVRASKRNSYHALEDSRRLRRKGAAGVLSAIRRTGSWGVPKLPFFGSFFRVSEKMNN